MLYLIIAVVWIACGALSYGIVFAYFQKEFKAIAKKQECFDRAVSLLAAAFGPLYLISVLIEFGTKHGLLYRSIHRGENHND